MLLVVCVCVNTRWFWISGWRAEKLGCTSEVYGSKSWAREDGKAFAAALGQKTEHRMGVEVRGWLLSVHWNTPHPQCPSAILHGGKRSSTWSVDSPAFSFTPRGRTAILIPQTESRAIHPITNKTASRTCFPSWPQAVSTKPSRF